MPDWKPLIPYAVAFIGAALLARLIVVTLRVRRFVRTAVRAQGTVVGYTTKQEDELVADATRESGMSTEKVTVYYPEVLFRTTEGRLITFRSRFKAPKAYLNAPIAVLYAPSAPDKTCEVVGWANQWDPVTRAVAQVVLFAIGAWMLLRWMSPR